MKPSAFIFALPLLLASCGGNPLDNPHSSAAVDSAAAYGRLDAAVFADSTASDMQREGALLKIRYKENHMRALGYDKAADAYVAAAVELIPDSIVQ